MSNILLFPGRLQIWFNMLYLNSFFQTDHTLTFFMATSLLLILHLALCTVLNCPRPICLMISKFCSLQYGASLSCTCRSAANAARPSTDTFCRDGWNSWLLYGDWGTELVAEDGGVEFGNCWIVDAPATDAAVCWWSGFAGSLGWPKARVWFPMVDGRWDCGEICSGWEGGCVDTGWILIWAPTGTCNKRTCPSGKLIWTVCICTGCCIWTWCIPVPPGSCIRTVWVCCCGTC